MALPSPDSVRASMTTARQTELHTRKMTFSGGRSLPRSFPSRLEQLRITEANLTALPPAAANLSHLRLLDLSNNKLKVGRVGEDQEAENVCAPKGCRKVLGSWQTRRSSTDRQPDRTKRYK